MKATTVKRLAILIAVLSLVGGTGFIAQRFQVKRLAAKQNQKRPSLPCQRGILRRPRRYSENTFKSFLTIWKYKSSMPIRF